MKEMNKTDISNVALLLETDRKSTLLAENALRSKPDLLSFGAPLVHCGARLNMKVRLHVKAS